MRLKTLAMLTAMLALVAAPLPAQVPQGAAALESAVEGVYTAASPSVVNITVQAVTYNFFNQPVPQQGTGSGFVYDTQGHIVTNYHVVEGANSIMVTFQDQKSYRATLVGSDSSNDLAVLQVKNTGLPAALPVVDSSSLKVGQFVIALGNPFGLQGTLTFGVISALGRTIQSPDGRFIGEAIQTDAPINPGNSGGPLLDLQGRVIGINSQIISPSGASSGIGFAVSSRTVMRVVPQLIATGRYPHPYLGVNGLDITADLADALRGGGIQVPSSGVLIVQVVPGSPADKAGIRGGSQVLVVGNDELPVGGDVLVGINNQPVTDFQDLGAYMDTHTRVGDAVTLTLMRSGKKIDLKTTLTEAPRSSQ